MDYPNARGVTGIAYLVKASQLFKDPKTVEQSGEYYDKARNSGINRWQIKDNCSKYCSDIARMLKAHKKFNSEQPI